ncbi:MAG: ABC transporter substrate-binding protein [Crocinitomicaceae bacterium]|nr:ABC transporter substrate-binding protein [Crocinitomicaceae bacterium]
MRYIIFSIFLLAGLSFTSCTETETKVEDLVAIGGKKYGGEFKFMSSEKVASLFPTSSADQYSSRMVSQIYESLVRLDPETMKVVPSVADSFYWNSDASVYTFNIRKGIKFHEDDCLSEGHELDANDVKFALDLACSGMEVNHVSYLLVHKIKGSADFFEASKTSIPAGGVPGVKVIDDYTIEITLEHSFSGFEYILTHSSLGIFPKEAWDTYGEDMATHPVGTGPFALESMSDEKMVLKRNNNYWREDEFGNQLPFLGKVIMTYTQDKRSELLAFRSAESDLVLEIPVEEIEHILGTLQEAQEGKNIKHKVESEASLSMTYVAMSIESEEFSDMRVRKAFNIAIDRDDIIDSYLEGEGWAANNGFVPTMSNYPSDEVNGHKFNAERAQSLMSEAGYANGNGFPTLDFYVNTLEGSPVHKLCLAIADQLKKNINVDLNIKLCTIEERGEAIASGAAKIWRAGWIADYPDPENFLAMFYGGNITDQSSMMNRFKFQSDAYDALYEQAIKESNAEKRTALFIQCDQMIIDEAAIMPMLTDDHIIMINARVRDFKANSMESLNLTEVFIKEPKKTEE